MRRKPFCKKLKLAEVVQPEPKIDTKFKVEPKVDAEAKAEAPPPAGEALTASSYCTKS
jgi:hypothetical protein